MTKINGKKQEVLDKLDAIMSPLQKHVNDLREMSNDGSLVAPSFLNGYEEKLNELSELKEAILEAFLEQYSDEIKEIKMLILQKEKKGIDIE